MGIVRGNCLKWQDFRYSHRWTTIVIYTRYTFNLPFFLNTIIHRCKTYFLDREPQNKYYNRLERLDIYLVETHWKYSKLTVWIRLRFPIFQQTLKRRWVGMASVSYCRWNPQRFDAVDVCRFIDAGQGYHVWFMVSKFNIYFFLMSS